MDEQTVKHLEMIQAVVSRLAQNSFAYKAGRPPSGADVLGAGRLLPRTGAPVPKALRRRTERNAHGPRNGAFLHGHVGL